MYAPAFIQGVVVVMELGRCGADRVLVGVVQRQHVDPGVSLCWRPLLGRPSDPSAPSGEVRTTVRRAGRSRSR